MIDEAVRLYSKAQRVPVDVVAPQHEDIHADLEKWGRWNRERTASRGCASAESVYEKTRTPGSTAHEVDLRSVQLERAVLNVPEPYRQTLRLFYVQGISPSALCKGFSMRHEAFAAWMFAARAMVVNLLMRHA